MNLIAIFGAGLLVGAALIVIVPEGMEVLYQSLEETQHQVMLKLSYDYLDSIRNIISKLIRVIRACSWGT